MITFDSKVLLNLAIVWKFSCVRIRYGYFARIALFSKIKCSTNQVSILIRWPHRKTSKCLLMLIIKKEVCCNVFYLIIQ